LADAVADAAVAVLSPPPTPPPVTPVEEVAETGLDGVVTVDEEAEEVSS